MLNDVAIIMFGIFKKHMNPNSCVYGDKIGIHIYDIDIPAEEIYQKFDEKEKAMLKKFGWVIDDGEFVKKN